MRSGVNLAASALQRKLEQPVLVLLSPSRAANRVTCFVFERRDPDPIAVLRGMADPRRGDEIMGELRFLARIRERIAGTTLYNTLPAEPLAVDRVAADVLVVEPYDALAALGRPGSRASAWTWLAQFQTHLMNDVRPLSRAETEALLRRVEAGWTAAGCTRILPPLISTLEKLMLEVREIAIPRCPVHGDFWRGNISSVDGRMRVYDWEWSAEDGLPTFDLWTYVLADLRLRRSPAARADLAVARSVADATGYLRAAGLPAALGALTIAPTLADIALRGEERSGRESDVLRDRWLFEAVASHLVDSVPIVAAPGPAR
jgi:hypothetical protein